MITRELTHDNLPEVSVGFLSSSVVSTLFTEPGSLCEPGTCYSSYTGWAASLRDYPVSINPAPCKGWDRVGVVAHC